MVPREKSVEISIEMDTNPFFINASSTDKCVGLSLCNTDSIAHEYKVDSTLRLLNTM